MRDDLQNEALGNANRMRETLDGSPATIWAQDPDLRYLWIYNPTMGLSESDVIGKTDHELLDDAFANRLAVLKNRAMQEDEEIRETVKTVSSEHNETHDLFIRPVKDDEGQSAGVVCVSMKMSKSQQTLADEANHRIKNNLMLAQALLRMQRKNSSEPAAHNALQQAEGQIASIARMHGNLAEGSSQGEVDVKDYLQTVCKDLRDSITEDAQLQLETDISKEMISGQSALKLALIVNELVTNSVKHAAQLTEPLVVKISYGHVDGQRQLEVKDNGDGLPVDFEHVTETGVGMRLLKTLARDLGSEIRIGREGGGACFTFTLPEKL